MIWIFALIAWIACGILAYGITLGYFEGEYPMISDRPMVYIINRILALIYFALGPVSLAVAFCLSRFAKHGLKFK